MNAPLGDSGEDRVTRAVVRGWGKGTRPGLIDAVIFLPGKKVLYSH